MKILDTPRSGALGTVVAFQSRYGLCLRTRVWPRNTTTQERQYMRRAFGHHSNSYSCKLSQGQMDRWRLAGAQVMSDPRLGQCGPLTGQQLYTSINSVRSRVTLPETQEVPVRPSFGRSPVVGLEITNTETGVRLGLRVSGELTEDVMVFGQEPCSAGRNKRRNVAYLGLVPPPINGVSDFTHLYRARYGEPRAGMKVFIVTCQEKEGWKGLEQEMSEVVPGRPEGEQAVATTADSQKLLMHKGSTRDAEGTGALPSGNLLGGIEAGTGGGEAAGTGLEGRKVAGEGGDAPG